MTNNMHFEILDEGRKETFKQLSKLFGEGFYLAGGTALALQIGHRKSFDFDIFCNKAISSALKNKIIKAFSDRHLQTLVDTSDEYTAAINGEIKITLLNYYWEPIFPLVKIPGLMPLLSIRDIASSKAYALGRRGNYRDYFDLYVIIKEGYATLKDIIKWCKKKYGDVFSEKMLLEQLTYLGDIEKDEKLMLCAEEYVSTAKLEKFFVSKIKELQ